MKPAKQITALLAAAAVSTPLSFYTPFALPSPAVFADAANLPDWSRNDLSCRDRKDRYANIENTKVYSISWSSF